MSGWHLPLIVYDAWFADVRNALNMPPSMNLSEVGYCTNVHAGTDLEQTRASLQEHALEVKRIFSPNEPMGVGLWLASPAAAALQERRALIGFQNWLDEVGLVPFTFNGFPFGDFHQKVVKHRVYHPTWDQPERLEYTLHLVNILDALLAPGKEGSISTLPLFWVSAGDHTDSLARCGAQLRRCAEALAKLEEKRNRLIYLCVEPEPGCVLQRGEDVVDFYTRFLLTASEQENQRILRHIRVCHDVCHAAVMFDPQAAVLKSYSDAGIKVGKVQVSSAIRASFNQLSAAEQRLVLEDLDLVAEDRYLHQSMIRGASEPSLNRFYEDLPDALSRLRDQDEVSGELRIHFHVPVYLESFGRLWTTQHEIKECLGLLREDESVKHYEVETYAWNVLPKSLKRETLAAGIADEMSWFVDLMTT